MRDEVELGVIAVGEGVLVGILLFVPFVAVSYRRRGRLTFGRFALWFALLVYVLAIWAYTLLPLPDPDQIRCSGTQLDALAFVDDLTGSIARGDPLTDPAFLQLALNVLLFIPLGFFVRLIGHGGFVVAILAGAGLSLFVELTQLTGVWGLYPCAYRVFDVVDLMTNTLGAFSGVLLALLIPRRYRVRPDQVMDARAPHPVTARRRLVGMLCDFLAVTLTGIAVDVIVVFGAYGFGQTDVSGSQWVNALVLGVPFAVTLLYTLLAGRTIGHAAVQLRYTGTAMPAAVARILRFTAGIGGYQVLLALPDAVSAWALPLFVLLSVVLVFTTKDRGGLPGLVSRQHLVDSRAAAPSGERSASADTQPGGRARRL